MRKKQIISVILAGAMSLGLLTGCGSGTGSSPDSASAPGTAAADTKTAPAPKEQEGDSQEKVELTFFYPIGVGGALATLIENLATEFTRENPNIVLTPVFTGDSGETTTKVISALQGGTPPDFAILANHELYTFLDMDAIAPLDDFISADGGPEYIDDFIPAFLENSYYDGHIYSIPFQRSTVIMYYNKDHFKEAGLDPEKPPVNWEELREYAKALTVKDSSGNVSRYGVLISDDNFIFSGFCRQNSTDPDFQLMSGDGKSVNFDTPENIEALQFLMGLKEEGVMPEGSIKFADAPSNFMAGAASIIATSSGNLTNILDNTDFEVGTAFLPAGKQYGSATGGANIYIFKDIDPKKQEAAWKFIRWVTEPQRAAQWSVDTGYVATRRSAYDTDLMKDYLSKVPQAVTAKEQVDYACSEIRVHDNQRVAQIFQQALDSAATKAASPEDALKKAQSEAEAILSDYQ
ncbi:MAG: ABC transporter substrate-binding protein [Hungatella sp.]|nr:ABC transporter substrate-binding protein [Hungatella sp.]